MEAEEVALRQGDLQAGADEATELVGGERAEAEPLHASLRKPFGKRGQRRLRLGIDPAGEKGADRLPLESS